MGKATRWLKGLFGIKGDPNSSKDRQFGSSGRDSGAGAGLCHNPATIPPNMTPAEAAWLRSYYPQAKDDGDSERNKHAIAVAAATAAAADAAVAAAQAAVEVVRLTSRGRNHSNNNLFAGDGLNWAAVRIQSNFRGYLARKALRALKGLVKIQALVRGYLVRKQATATLHGMQALIRAQATVRSKRASYGPKRDPVCLGPQAQSAPLHWAPKGRSGQHCNAPLSPVQSRRLSASFEARTLNPPIDQDTPKVVEVDIGHPGSISGLIRPRPNRSYSELGEDPASYQTLPAQLTPGRICIPNHHHQNHQCCHQFQYPEWGFSADECGSTTMQTTPQFSSLGFGPDGTGLVPTLMPRPGADVFYGGWGRQQLYYHYPNYMDKTMSFKAKVRSQSAPKQRPDPINGVSSRTRMSLSEIMEARNSLSGVRMQRSCSQVQEAINFKNAVMGKLGKSPC